MKYLRTAVWGLFALATIIVALLMLPLFWLMRLVGRNPDSLARRYAAWWGRAVLWATGSRVILSGQRQLPPGPVVLMGNHQSIFDIMLLLGYVDKPVAFIAKIETASYPVISTWMKYLHCLFLDRKDLRQSTRVLQQAVAQLQQGGASLVIFPEGTRSRTGEMLEFKRGSMKLPQRANVPIVPITIDGTLWVFEGTGRTIAPSTVKLHFGSALLPEEFASRDTAEISNMVRQRVSQGLTMIRNNG